MSKSQIIFSMISILIASSAMAEKFTVFTAFEFFDSRIYLIGENGTTKTFDLPTMRLADIEIIGDQLYVSEAFAPRVFRIDLKKEELDVIVDDWSRTVFYDLAYDGQYLYNVEGRLFRYDMNGKRIDSAKFEGRYIMGSTFANGQLWTLNRKGIMQAWDLKQWPKVTEIKRQQMRAPTNKSKGLWFDGQNFWTAETGLGGQIFKFSMDGKSIKAWPHGDSNAWAAGIIEL